MFHLKKASLVPQEIRPQELSVPQRSAQRSSQRPLSPIVRSESTKTLNQSAVKDSFNSTGSSLAAPVDFSATTTATTTTPILSEPGKRSSMLKSNSASVVAQFLDYDENEERSTEKRPLSKDIDIVLQSTLENDDGDLKPSNRRSTDSRKLAFIKQNSSKKHCRRFITKVTYRPPERDGVER